MFVAFLLLTGLTAYAVMARLWSPSIDQLQKEFEDAQVQYSRNDNFISRLGLSVNRLHFQIIANCNAIICSLCVAWFVCALLWVAH